MNMKRTISTINTFVSLLLLVVAIDLDNSNDHCQFRDGPSLPLPNDLEYDYQVELTRNGKFKPLESYFGSIRLLILIDKEFIVAFRTFLDKPSRHAQLVELMRTRNVSRYDVLAKNRLFDTLPSDFDVIRVRKLSQRLLYLNVLSQLNFYPDLRRYRKDKRVIGFGEKRRLVGNQRGFRTTQIDPNTQVVEKSRL